MKKTMTLLCLVLLVGTMQAQQNSFAKANLTIWKNAKARTIAVATAMPQDKYNYKPTDDVMSFGQQMAHIANSMRSMEMRFLKNSGWNHREPDASKMTKDEIVALLGNSFDAVIATIEGLSEASLSTPGKNFGNPPLNKEQSMLFMYDHITNHRAKAVLYLRLNGINPPRYGFN